MKKILFLILAFFCISMAAYADFVPAYTNSINHFGIGAARVTNYIIIYEKPDLNSKVIKRIYWNNIGNFISENNKNETTKSIGEELDKVENYIEQALYYARSNTVEKDYIIRKTELKEVVNNDVITEKQEDYSLGYTMESYANRELDIPLDLKYNYYSYDIQNNIFYKYIAAKKYK